MMSGLMPEYPTDPGARRPARRGRIIFGIALLVLAGAAGGWYRTTLKEAPPLTAVVMAPDSTARAPAGTRIRVRVLNTTTSRGLARRATFVLRDLGYDVVDFDGESSNRATTLILAHTARTDWALRLQKAVGATAIESRPDASRYVDFTVLLGRDWQRAPETFRP